MQKNIYLPQIELTMESATVIAWRAQVGDYVEAGQPMVEVETQKAVTEVPAEAAGYVRRLCVAAGEEIPARALLCILTDSADETITVPRGPEFTSSTPSAASSSDIEGGAEAGDSGIVKAVPAARRLAKENAIDLNAINGSGPGGRITIADVEAAIAARK